MTDLTKIAMQHQRAFNYPPVQETVQFIGNVLDVLHNRVSPGAQDTKARCTKRR
jgi:hypothetical protein